MQYVLNLSLQQFKRQNSLSIRLGIYVLTGEQNPKQLHDERSSSLPCYDYREDKILNSHSKDA